MRRFIAAGIVAFLLWSTWQVINIAAQGTSAPDKLRSSIQIAPGKFGKALDAGKTPALIEGDASFRKPPLTVECWAKLNSKKNFNILVASDDKSSSLHWEIYSYTGSGAFSAYFPGKEPSEIISKVDICDGQWHYLAMQYDGQKVRLFVDAKEVKEQSVKPKAGLGPEPGPLTIGMVLFGNQHIGCDGLIDEVRISNILRDIKEVPKTAPKLDQHTVGLWPFDSLEGFAADPAWTPRPITGAGVPAWWKETDKDWVDDRFRYMDTGYHFNGTIAYPKSKEMAFRAKTLAYRGTAIRLGDKGEAAILFDRNQLRYAAGWTGSFLLHTDRRFGLLNTPTPAGDMVFTTAPGLGWANPDRKWDNLFGVWDSPQSPFTALPEKWGKFHGIYRHGKRTVLSYSIGGMEVLDSPWIEKGFGITVLTRTFHIAPSPKRQEILLIGKGLSFEGSADVGGLYGGARGFSRINQDQQIFVCYSHTKGDKDQVHLISGEDYSSLEIPPHTAPMLVKMFYWLGPDKEYPNLKKIINGMAPPEDLKQFIKPGPAQWNADITTQGIVARDDEPYVIDTLTIPYQNPYKALFFASGLDFMPSGDIAMSTVHGDVWLVKGVDDKLEKLTWKRFATGLYQPLGLKVIDGKIHVLERGQLTRLHDYNGDGEADFYECINDQWHISGGEHSYDTCLETDPQGNFYFFNGGDTDTPTGGCLLKVSKDGKKLDIFATGFRHPIGLGMSPTGIVTGADQEGNWMPGTRIDVYKKGGFYGDMRAHHQKVPPKIYDQPLCWLPREMDNSAGGQVWVPEGKFGPLSGQMLHLSYGRCRILQVLQQKVGDVPQGGAADLGLQFLSGVMRGRFHPKDGHLYVCGMDGWQSAAIKDGCLQRVRYTGKKTALPTSLAVHADGIRLGFSQPIPKKIAEDLSRYRIAQWNYKWSADYGSKRWSLKNPGKLGEDAVPIKSATLLADGKSVFLKIDHVQPVMQMQISYNLSTTEGQTLQGMIYNTIHQPAGAFLSKGN